MQLLARLKRASLRLFFSLQKEERIHLVVVLQSLEAWAGHIEDNREDVTSLSPAAFGFFPTLASDDGEPLRHRPQWMCSRTLPHVITSSVSGNRVWQQTGSLPAVSKMRFIHSGIDGVQGILLFMSLPGDTRGHALTPFFFFFFHPNPKLHPLSDF